MTLPDHLQALMQPASYPHSCGQIHCIETHISWLMLTGDRVYKLRKPVDFGFLDFSTLAYRKEDCELEYQLNLRTAPQLYLGVMAIIRSCSGIRICDVAELTSADTVLEYAVQMLQFEESHVFSELLRNGQLDQALLKRFAEYIAQFHQSLPPATLQTSWGDLENLLAPVEQNFTQIGPRLTTESDQLKLHDLQHWSLNEFERLRPLFLQRKSQGFVRECHGDLHLGNLVLYNGEPLAFDCLEFNPSLRWIDVINDLGFLVMDLEFRGEAALASVLLNTYLEHTGDYQGLRVLRFYKVYRALVRAKVLCLRAEQLDDVAQQDEAWQAYRTYIHYALSLLQPSLPFLAITHGVSGTGKTTVARAVSTAMGAVHLRSDVERKRLFGLQPTQVSSSQIKARMYSREASVHTFEQLRLLADLLIQDGFPVVVDATFLHLRARQPFQVLAETRQVPFAILDCALDEQSLRDRLRARCAAGDDASEATVEIMEQQVQDQDYLSQLEKGFTIRFDTHKPLPPQVQAFGARLAVAKA